jgi:predicted DNA-binding transcriptional regulator
VGKDQVVGVVLMPVSISIIVGYGWLLFFTEWTLLLIQLTLMIAVAAVLGVVAWIGYTLATTPPPKSIEEIEKEIQHELETLEKEGHQEEGKQEN